MNTGNSESFVNDKYFKDAIKSEDSRVASLIETVYFLSVLKYAGK